MNGSTKTLMTGIFVLVSFLILVWVILWLEPSVGDEGQVIHVRFTNIDKINDGTRVTFAGQPVGVVYEVREVKDARLEPHDDRVYVYELTLHVDSELDVYTTDLFSVRTSGLLGERSIEITPVARGCCNDLVPITPKDILFAVPTGSVEEAFSQFSSLSKGAKQIFDKVGDAVDKLEENHFWDNLALIADHLEAEA
jgi:phospholipid/cholesterol/gamma-HCH transport system substrate-binding protein